jgi:hypothetical protein
MLVIDISINRIKNTHEIGAVRIRPKHTPALGEMCTYEYGYVNSGGRIDPIGKTDFPYGDALELSHHILGLMLEIKD